MKADLLDEREFQFTDKDFARIKDRIKAEAGIHLTDAKKTLVYGRLVRRIRALGLPDFTSYLKQVDQDDQELTEFVNAITTNMTFFFRQSAQFEHLGKTLIPAMRAAGERGPLKIWSAACSTGQEPYSLAMTAFEAEPSNKQPARILATDLDTEVLATARAGIYKADAVEQLTPSQRSRWFLKGRGGQAGLVKANQDLQSLIKFGQLNLNGEWPLRGPFHAIFCRNVVIYFDQETKARLFERLIDLMHPKGALYLGYSEALVGVGDRLKLVAKGTYQLKR